MVLTIPFRNNDLICFNMSECIKRYKMLANSLGCDIELDDSNIKIKGNHIEIFDVYLDLYCVILKSKIQKLCLYKNDINDLYDDNMYFIKTINRLRRLLNTTYYDMERISNWNASYEKDINYDSMAYYTDNYDIYKRRLKELDVVIKNSYNSEYYDNLIYYDKCLTKIMETLDYDIFKMRDNTIRYKNIIRQLEIYLLEINNDFRFDIGYIHGYHNPVLYDYIIKDDDPESESNSEDESEDESEAESDGISE